MSTYANRRNDPRFSWPAAPTPGPFYRKEPAMTFDDTDRSMFENPGGSSALRRSSRENPRNLPCPTCGRPNRLTPADVRLGYQCDRCADAAEGRGPASEY